MRPAAIPTFMAISGVIGKLLASPRTPSVPNNLRVMSEVFPSGRVAALVCARTIPNPRLHMPEPWNHRELRLVAGEDRPDRQGILERLGIMGANEVRPVQGSEQFGG